MNGENVFSELRIWCAPTSKSTTSRDPVEAVLEDAFEAYHRPIFRFLIALNCTREEAEEIVQELFLRLYLRLQERPPVRNIRSWLFQVARRQRIDQTRIVRPEVNIPDEGWDSLGDALIDPAPNPESTLLERQRQERFYRAMAQLPARQREYLNLRAEGWLLRDIADLYGVSVAAVADGLVRATQRVGKVLRGEGQGSEIHG